MEGHFGKCLEALREVRVPRVFYACASGAAERWQSTVCVTSCPSMGGNLPRSHDALNTPQTDCALVCGEIFLIKIRRYFKGAPQA
jgi:hypothetical protein